MARSVRVGLCIALGRDEVRHFKSISIGLGTALPIVLMIATLLRAEVSYGVANVCTPNHRTGVASWFAWLLVMTCLNAVLQVLTMSYCLWRSVRAASTQRVCSNESTRINRQDDHEHSMGGLSVLRLHWRSVAWILIAVNLTIFFGIVFIQDETMSPSRTVRQRITAENERWFRCLAANQGNHTGCLGLSSGIGLRESQAIGTMVVASVRHSPSTNVIRPLIVSSVWGRSSLYSHLGGP